MRKDDLNRLWHMLDAVKEAQSFAAWKSRGDLSADRKLALAIVKDIEIIGEAAIKVSQETRISHPAIPWPDIINMRNRLIHRTSILTSTSYGTRSPKTCRPS